MCFWRTAEQKSHDRAYCIVIIVLFVGSAMLLLPLFRYHLQNDSFAYLSLAATQSSNPYWGPMLPRLIAFFTTLGVTPLTAIRLPSILASVVLLSIAALSRTLLPVSRAVWNTLLVTLAIFLLTKTLDIATPDILLTCLLVLMLRFAVVTTKLGAILTGLTAGLGYLTKSVALPFFLLFALLLLARRVIAEPREWKRAVLACGLSILSCAVIITPWIVTISREHGGFTIGESARIIHATMNPLQDHEIPMNVRGLLPPPSDVALSIWDDPTALEYRDWSPLSSGKNFVMQLKIIVINASRMIDVVFREFWLTWALLGGAAVTAMQKKRDVLTSWSQLTVAVWTILLCLYLPIVTDDRYIWIGIMVLLATGALLMERIMQTMQWTTAQRNVALVVFFLAFTAYPTWRTLNAMHDGKRLAMDATEVATTIGIQGSRTASDSWKIGLAFSYFADTRYFGKPKNVKDTEELSRELRDHSIDIYLATSTPPKIPGFATLYTTKGGIHVLRRTTTD